MELPEPLPCFVCGELPKVGSFLLMDLRHHGWTCLCPNRCYETGTYLSRDFAVRDWNAWVESEGDVYQGEGTHHDEWEDA